MRKATDRQRFRLEHAGFSFTADFGQGPKGYLAQSTETELVSATILRFVRLLNWPRPLCFVLAGLVPAAVSPVEKMVGKLFWVASLPGL